ncbi:MAG: GNAT family N-acetyltransferase [Candidatus Marinimicrobia bacterium]|nr:GNAT family N-acetyltransferase [Candidatus Neomarinimicrobiota bacterium]
MIIKVSDTIQLKSLETQHVPSLFYIIDTQREYLGRWLPFVHFTHKIEHTELFVKSVVYAPESRFEHIFTIFYQDEIVGLIGFKDSDRANQKTELGYWLSEKFQKKGIVTQSVRALCSFAFEELKINRLQIKVANGNIPSKKIPRRLNFHFEGIEREGEKQYDGSFADLEIYSLLKIEFLKQKD